MTDRIEHHIDLRALHHIGHTGIRRAVLFMGLGLNAAHRSDFNDYQLHKLPHFPGQTQFPMEFFPDDLPNERVQHFKHEFGSWVIGCGLREILEHYALVLDQIHLHALVLLRSQKKLPEDFDGEKQHERFQRCGLEEKFKTLRKRTGIVIDGADSACQLYIARNALTHDLGLVTAGRAPTGNLSITWRAFDIVGVGIVSGKAVPIMEMIGKVTEEETQIQATVQPRQKDFALGSQIRLTSQDLWEICFFFNAIVLDSTLKQFGNWVKENGVPERAA